MSIPQAIINAISEKYKRLMPQYNTRITPKTLKKDFHNLFQEIKTSMRIPKTKTLREVQAWIKQIEKTRPAELLFFKNEANLNALQTLLESETRQLFTHKYIMALDNRQQNLLEKEIEGASKIFREKFEALFQSVQNIYLPYYERQLVETKSRKTKNQLFWEKTTPEDIKTSLRSVLSPLNIERPNKNKTTRKTTLKKAREFRTNYKKLPTAIRMLLALPREDLSQKLHDNLKKEDAGKIQVLISTFAWVKANIIVLDREYKRVKTEVIETRTLKGAFEAIKVAIQINNPTAVLQIKKSLTPAQLIAFNERFKNSPLPNLIGGTDKTDIDIKKDVLSAYQKHKLTPYLNDTVAMAEAFLDESKMKILEELGFDPKKYLSIKNRKMSGPIINQIQKMIIDGLVKKDGTPKLPNEINNAYKKIRASTSEKEVRTELANLRNLLHEQRTDTVQNTIEEISTKIKGCYFETDAIKKDFLTRIAENNQQEGLLEYYETAQADANIKIYELAEQKRSTGDIANETDAEKKKALIQKQSEERALKGTSLERDLKIASPKFHLWLKKNCAAYTGTFNSILHDVRDQLRRAQDGKKGIGTNSINTLKKIADMRYIGNIRQFITKAKEFLEEKDIESFLNHIENRSLYELDTKHTTPDTDRRRSQAKKEQNLLPSNIKAKKQKEYLILVRKLLREKATERKDKKLTTLLDLEKDLMTAKNYKYNNRLLNQKMASIYMREVSSNENMDAIQLEEHIRKSSEKFTTNMLGVVRRQIKGHPAYQKAEEKANLALASETYERFSHMFTTYGHKYGAAIKEYLPHDLKDSGRTLLKQDEDLTELLGGSIGQRTKIGREITGASFAQIIVHFTETQEQLDAVKKVISELTPGVSLKQLEKNYPHPNIEIPDQDWDRFSPGTPGAYTRYSGLQEIITKKETMLNPNKIIGRTITEHESLLTTKDITPN